VGIYCNDLTTICFIIIYAVNHHLAPPGRVFPWYSRYRDLLLSVGGASDHETFDHPVASIIAISSLSPDPINEIHQLNNMSTPAVVFDKAYIDPTILKYYVLIHDNARGNIDK